MQNVRNKRVWVGLSGGVDSAVSAALLKEAGAQITGVFIKGWYPLGMPCTWARDRRDAMRVAARLHIPFETLDASAEYKREVIDYLVREYRAGRTPNPDIMCNKEIKFGVFYRRARAAGADYIATGHYRSGEKDQSYFLWAVPKDVLEKTIFPVGHRDKKEVRVLAKKFNLPVSEKKDSQGVCFLGSVSIEEFLRKEFGTAPGEAVDVEGNQVGTHDSALFYTIGERVALQDAQSSGPWFVRAKDIKQNKLIVGPHTGVSPGFAEDIRFADANWFLNSETATCAQYRYRGARIAGVVHGDRFIPKEPLPEPVAPGQSVVFYRDDELVGGGIIAE